MRAGRVRSCHDLSEGGLVVALAEMAIGGRLGIEVDLEGMQPVGLETKHQLFAESNGRLLVEVRDEHGHAFETCMENIPLSLLGHVAPGDRLNVNRAGAPVLSVSLGELLTAWKGESA
jgi:phosphoribosylformylglycinamidine synthase